MWTRYTSSGERGSTKGWRIFGTLVKGGMGPVDEELGVETPDEAGVDAGVLRREDFVMVCYSVDTFGLLEVVRENSWFSLPGLHCALASFIRPRPQLMISANERVTCHESLASERTVLA